ncbi:MAG: hypothetical protein PUF13_10770 [Lachnospiraceae bacterium]|nr:hypothetical protein [Lachnospiraceae bacterium]
MNYYLTAIEGMPKLLEPAGEVLASFKKPLYADAFSKMYQRHVSTFDALEKGCQMVIDKDQYLINMAEALVKEAAGRVEECRRRAEKERVLMDLNLQMAAYVLPMILEYRGESSRPLAEKVIEAWKREFPKTNLHAACYQEIEQGFHKKFCYITTAACQVLGKPDDCRELTVLREYRDTYLASLPEGEKIIRRYYDVAPSIVKHINQQQDSETVYQNIWKIYLQPCIDLIDADRPEECRILYEEMVNSLEEKYFMA